jgi:SAM-dependent methyltransferase
MSCAGRHGARPGLPVSANANQAQIEFWNGAETRQWVERQRDYDRQLEPFASAVLGAADVGTGSSVLDFGCGCGTLTLRAANLGKRATGVDISVPMIERAVAVARDQKVTNAEFLVADAQTHRFAPEFDIAVSRFGAMFFDDPEAAFANIRTSLRPGGRLVFCCWQELARNDWVLLPGMAAAEHLPLPGPHIGPGPFSLAAPGPLVTLLETAGFADVELESLESPMLVAGGGTVEKTLDFFMHNSMVRAMFEGADPACRRTGACGRAGGAGRAPRGGRRSDGLSLLDRLGPEITVVCVAACPTARHT